MATKSINLVVRLKKLNLDMDSDGEDDLLDIQRETKAILCSNS